MNAKAGKKASAGDEVEPLRHHVEAALAAINVLFEVPGPDGRMTVGDLEHRELVLRLRTLLRTMRSELEAPESGSDRYFQVTAAEGADSVDLLNSLADYCRDRSLTDGLEAALVDLVVGYRDFFAVMTGRVRPQYDRLLGLLRHARRLFFACPAIFRDYPAWLKRSAGPARNRIGRLHPGVTEMSGSVGLPGELKASGPDEAWLGRLREMTERADLFGLGRVFRYFDSRFMPVDLNSIRPVDQFYGYSRVKSLFERHFSSFAHEDNHIPLILTSLPGMGKTQFTISYTMAFPELTLVLPEPEDLGKGLPALIRRLGRRRNRRFVVFFDDIDPRQVDWYYFRTNIGGSLPAPDNVILVLASNYEFPPNVCSRGREVEFPLFDAATCDGMIYDYLISLKMRTPSNDLVAVMAADYLEEFGQNVYAELSPRSLVRYLANYDRDARRRRRMLDLSRSDVLPQPDAQAFQDFNVRLIRDFYGERGLEDLRDRILRRLSGTSESE